MDDRKVVFLQAKSQEIRKSVIRMIGRAGGGHIGGSLSAVEAVVYLYYHAMIGIKPGVAPFERDIFILSKGHAGPVQYAVLADLGFFPAEWLDTLNAAGTNLPSHCNMALTPGVDFTTGSLGQGLSVAAGMALGARLRGSSSRVFAMIGDGESQEGQVWEAAMFASHYKLSNLIAFTDANQQQIDGYVKDIMDIEDIAEKWRSFGWETERVDGHDFTALDRAVARAGSVDKPLMVVLDTVKARGFAPGEGNIKNHSMDYNSEAAEEAIRAMPTV